MSPRNSDNSVHVFDLGSFDRHCFFNGSIPGSPNWLIVSTLSAEEVEAVSKAAEALLGGRLTDKGGVTRQVEQADIIVVAPYNAQVNALRDALPRGIRVGTVDKFQGQEAAICMVSMTASAMEDSTRGMEFLFSLNRINVAISRAKTLALVFGAPRLRETKCKTIEQMRLANTLCALPDFS